MKKYNTNSSYKNAMRMFLALAYVKPDRVVGTFLMVKNRIEVLFPCDNTKKFIEYFDKTYIGSVSTPIFQVKNWSTYIRVLSDIPITTNTCEAWNRGINNSVGTAHPSLNEIVKELRTRDFLITGNIFKHLLAPNIINRSRIYLRLKEVVEQHNCYPELVYLNLIVAIKSEKRRLKKF